MSRATPLINNFNSGELSPWMDTRVDVSKYYAGCRTLENFIPLVEGGAKRMPGTYYVEATKSVAAMTITGISKAATAVVTCTTVPVTLIAGDAVFITGVVGMTQVNGRYFIVAAVTTGASGHFQLVGESSSAYDAWVSGGTAQEISPVRLVPFHFSTVQAYVIEFGHHYCRFYMDGGQILSGGNPYEITTPYAYSDLFQLKFTQSADVLYIFHPDYVPKKLSRTAHTTWTLTDLVCATGTAMTITGISKAATAVVTCTTVPTTLAAGDIVFITGVVGMTQVNNLYFTTGTVVTGAGGTFQLSGINSTGYGAWSSAGTAQECVYGTTDNCPACGTFYQQRLCLAGSNNDPQEIWMSGSGDYQNFTLDAADDSAGIQVTVVSNKVDRIRWLIGLDFLFAGTVGGVWKVGAATSTDAITQANISTIKQVTLQSKNIDPEIVTDALLWVTRAGTSIRQFVYEYTQDKWVSPDMTRIARHITRGATQALSGITDMDFQKEPIPILWCVRADGQFVGLTYESQEQVYAFFRVVTPGYFESVAVISNEDEENQVWVLVRRNIDGVDVRYIEYFMPQDFFSQITDCFFVHCGITFDGGAAATVTAISNADPCVVALMADHGVTAADKLKFRGTGTWLDTHIVTAHSVSTNNVTIWNEADDAAIDSTDFPVYVYPPVATTTTYTGTPVNIVFAEQSNPCKIIAYNHAIAATTPIRIADVGGMTDLNDDFTTVTVTQDTITVSLDATALEAYTTGGTITEGSTTTLAAGTAQIVANGFASGLEHLEDEVVDILIDGAAHPQRKVAAGAISLAWYGNKIHVGLPAPAILEPMKLYAGSQLGSSRGKKQKVDKLTVAFYETVGGKAGPDQNNLKVIPFGTGGQPSLFTGDVDFEFGGDWKNEAAISIVQDQPLPMTILAMVPRLTVNED